jgi:hypothetical protein
MKLTSQLRKATAQWSYHKMQYLRRRIGRRDRLRRARGVEKAHRQILACMPRNTSPAK